MKAPVRLKVKTKCSGCYARSGGFFCNFSTAALSAFEAIAAPAVYPAGKTLFVQGQPSTGIYVLCQGRVKLSTYSEDGKAIILRVAEAGEALGLSSALCGSPQKATAEVIETCHVVFAERRAFLKFLNQYAEGGVNSSRQLSHNYNAAYSQVRLLGLSNSVTEKLARLIWQWAIEAKSRDVSEFCIAFTHQEIAEMIGTSRETVTRLFNDFKARGLISIRGHQATIENSDYFISMAGRAS